MSKKATTALQTPIEEILKVENSRVSAKVLYEFLELDKTQYSRWCKTQINENPYAEPNVDFIGSTLMSNAENKGMQAHPTTD
ncbi:hypothetical protein AGMMS49975_26290 [Clostridia bacterium]|nr:hypothetical protein AGMMS49975_26290 [Clostridia bacterium]